MFLWTSFLKTSLSKVLCHILVGPPSQSLLIQRDSKPVMISSISKEFSNTLLSSCIVCIIDNGGVSLDEPKNVRRTNGYSITGS